MSRSPDRFWHPARRTIRRAHSAIAAHWRRLREPQEGSIVLLDDVRLRLEHYLRAMYGRTIRVESVTETHDANWSRRARRHFGLMRAPTSSESDELCIRLPSRLGNDRDGVTALQRYRVLAVQHAERIHRASAAHAAGAASMLERDLFLLAESVAVNATLATNQPGLRRELSAARASALAQRTMPNTLTHVERRVETMIRSSLAAAASDERGPHRVSAAESAEWARETATALEQEFRVEMRRYYRGVSPIALWGTSLITRSTGIADSATAQERRVVDASNAPAEPKREATRQMSPSPSSTPDAQLQDADGNDALEQNAESPSPEIDESNADAAQRSNDADSDSAPSPSDDAAGAGSPDTRSNAAASKSLPADAVAYRYREWDIHKNDYRPEGAVVRVVPSMQVSSAWCDDTLRDHVVLVRQARQQFELLQSHRTRLPRQDQGDELDLDACVAAVVDRRMGVTPDERVYVKVHPGRRELAITLLVDASQSTRDIVFDGQRVIDVERLAALVAAAAFDSLGDAYSILAFSSDGAADVRLTTIKDFSETNTQVVRERMAALAPNGKTRLGAAIRHATAQLERHGAPHRLLLVLSDGKPNDRDGYFLDYGVEDSRRAVVDARADGILPYCITVDREAAADYMADIFGASGYLTVQKPAQLPKALLGAVQRLLSH